MRKTTFTFVLLHKVTATLHNYLTDFPCTYLVGAKRHDCKENYLKEGITQGSRPIHIDFSQIHM